MDKCPDRSAAGACCATGQAQARCRAHAAQRVELEDGHIVAPPKIPQYILDTAKPEAPLPDDKSGAFSELAQAGPNITPSIFANRAQPVVVHRPSGPVHLTSVIAEGMILQKT